MSRFVKFILQSHSFYTALIIDRRQTPFLFCKKIEGCQITGPSRPQWLSEDTHCEYSYFPPSIPSINNFLHLFLYLVYMVPRVLADMHACTACSRVYSPTYFLGCAFFGLLVQNFYFCNNQIEKYIQSNTFDNNFTPGNYTFMHG